MICHCSLSTQEEIQRSLPLPPTPFPPPFTSGDEKNNLSISDETYESIREPEVETVSSEMFLKNANLLVSHVATGPSETQLQSFNLKNLNVSDHSEDRACDGGGRRSSTGSEILYNKIKEDKHTSSLTRQAPRYERKSKLIHANESWKDISDISSIDVTDIFPSSWEAGNLATRREHVILDENGYVIPNKQTPQTDVFLPQQSRNSTHCMPPGEDGYNMPDADTELLNSALKDITRMCGLLHGTHSHSFISEDEGHNENSEIVEAVAAKKSRDRGRNIPNMGLMASNNTERGRRPHISGIQSPDEIQGNSLRNTNNVDEFGYLILDAEVSTSHEKLVLGQEGNNLHSENFCKCPMVSFNDTEGAASMIGEAGYVAPSDEGRNNPLSRFSAELALHRNPRLMGSSLNVDATPTTVDDTLFMWYTYLNLEYMTCELSIDDTDDFDKHEGQVEYQQNIANKDTDVSAVAVMIDKTAHVNTQAIEHISFVPDRILEKQDVDRDITVSEHEGQVEWQQSIANKDTDVSPVAVMIDKAAHVNTQAIEHIYFAPDRILEKQVDRETTVSENASRMKVPNMKLVARMDTGNAQEETVSTDMETFVRNKTSQVHDTDQLS